MVPVPDGDRFRDGLQSGRDHISDVVEGPMAEQKVREECRITAKAENLLLAGRQPLRVEVAQLEGREDQLMQEEMAVRRESTEWIGRALTTAALL